MQIFSMFHITFLQVAVKPKAVFTASVDGSRTKENGDPLTAVCQNINQKENRSKAII